MGTAVAMSSTAAAVAAVLQEIMTETEAIMDLEAGALVDGRMIGKVVASTGNAVSLVVTAAASPSVRPATVMLMAVADTPITMVRSGETGRETRLI